MATRKVYVAASFIASVLHFIVFILPYWRRLYEKSNVNVAGVIVGLWTRCYLITPGNKWTCDFYDNDLEDGLKIKRCVMLIAIFATINSVLFLVNPLNECVKGVNA